MSPVIPTRRMDAIDAEKFAQMVESEYFQALWKRIQAELSRNEEACVTSDAQLELHRAQGAVKALRVVLQLPEMLLAEMKAGPRYQRPIPRNASNNRA